MVRSARQRAIEAAVPFAITWQDVVIPSHCPILGLPLFQRVGTRGPGPNSPTLDRIQPELGYVPGNILVISARANRLKSDATLEELRAIASFYATFQRNVRVTGGSKT